MQWCSLCHSVKWRTKFPLFDKSLTYSQYIQFDVTVSVSITSIYTTLVSKFIFTTLKIVIDLISVVTRGYTNSNHHEHNDEKCQKMFVAIKDYFAPPKQMKPVVVEVDENKFAKVEDCETCDETGIIVVFEKLWNFLSLWGLLRRFFFQIIVLSIVKWNLNYQEKTTMSNGFNTFFMENKCLVFFCSPVKKKLAKKNNICYILFFLF